ncbi:paramyosin-like [Parasteatoda tepidariorum]|uniref:paramyosin-like n=1 Tax=Parasteatoda tepidariorum TaxID=114398 RepID=UPI0039BCB86C
MAVVDKSLTSDSMPFDSAEESVLYYVPSELETLTEELLYSRKETALLERKSASLIKALQVLSEKLDEEENARAKLQAENLKLISNLKEFREENAELEHLYQKMTIDIDEKNHQIIDLQQQLDMKENEVLLKLEEKESYIQKLQSGNVKLHLELKELKRDLAVPEIKHQEMTIDIVEKKNQIIELQQQLVMKENKLNEALLKLEKEKCEREKLQLEKFSSDASLKKLKKDIVILENKNKKMTEVIKIEQNFAEIARKQMDIKINQVHCQQEAYKSIQRQLHSKILNLKLQNQN